ncbi:MAG: alpha-L-fucosidase, partial [Bacteroidales bacterium]
RGIGTSFGYNRTENLDSYSSCEDLIKLLISTVSAGGNLLLDIGPAADGTIPVIMQQRLLEIGKWLGVNGEAIYGTRAFIRNKKEEQINPETNKTIFFTKMGKDLYILCLTWPGNNIVLKGIKPGTGTKASYMGSSAAVILKQSGNGVVIVPPKLTPDDYQPAYVFRLTNVLK